MGYENEYIKSKGNKELFMDLMRSKYTGVIKESTMKRRFYDCRKYIKKISRFNPDELERPNMFKIIQIEDMKKYNFQITRKYLHKYNFTNFEINWLMEEGHINEKK